MLLRFFSFSIFIATGALLGHLYLYRRLVRDTVRSRALRLLAVAVFVWMTLVLLLRRTRLDTLPVELSDALSVVTYTWMGVALLLVIALLVLDLGRGLVALGRRLRAPAPLPVDEERRRFLSRAVAGGAAVTGGGAWTSRSPATPMVGNSSP